MKKLLHDAEIGEIVYEESFWTGKKTIYINSEPLMKEGKNTFSRIVDGEKQLVSIRGNIYSGIYLVVNGKTLVVSEKPEWYEIALSVLTFAIVLVWGNSPALCSVIPVVGGAIGGAISGVMAVTNLTLMMSAKEVWKKLLIGVGMLVGSFLICFLIATAMLSLLV